MIYLKIIKDCVQIILRTLGGTLAQGNMQNIQRLYSHDNYHIHLDQNSTMKSAFNAPTSNSKRYILLHRIIKMYYVQLLQAHSYYDFEHSLKYNLETQTFHFQLLHPFTFCNNRRIANTFLSTSLHSDSKHIV